MKKINTTQARVTPETNEKAKQLARELSVIQNDKVSVPEIFRRVMNIPNIENVLKVDAINKRRIR